MIVLVNGQEAVVQLQGFLSVRNQDNFCSLLGQGVCYPFHLRDNGEAERNFWSCFVKVECKTSCQLHSLFSQRHLQKSYSISK